MVWRIEFERSAEQELARLGTADARRILRFLAERIAPLDNPRSIGQALQGQRLGEFWRYRVGACRIICKIADERLLILVIRVGQRGDVYR